MTPRSRGATPARAPARYCWLRRLASSSRGEGDMQSTSAIRIRRATSDDAAALAEFGARTFYEAFAADNTAEDMTKHLASAWGPDLQRAEIADPAARYPAGSGRERQLRRFRTTAGGTRAGRCSNAKAGGAEALLCRQALAGPGTGARSHGRSRAAGAAARRARVVARCLAAQRAGQAFYSKCGFRKVGTQVFVVGDDPQTDDIMLKEIT